MATRQADNITMAGGGTYSLATRGAKDVIDRATPRVLAAVEAMQLPSSLSRFAMADMGCADGGTSLDMVAAVLSRVQSVAPDVQSTVTYADQPRNDFNALVQIAEGLGPFESWARSFERAWPLVSGASFYTQAVPDDSLDLVFSATAMHWLSGKPCDIADHVHMVGAAPTELRVFAEQAASDWICIVQHRSRELKPGGRAVFANFCRDPNGHYLGNTTGVNMFDTLAEIWREFVADGVVNEHELARMTLPQYYRTVEEFVAPFEQGDVPGLQLESIETAHVRCPYAAQFAEDGDLDVFADGLIGTIRSWNQSIFYGGLDPERPADERQAIIDDYYQAYRSRVLDDPTGHGMDYVHAYMTVVKPA
ncbi:MAG: SAM-dependent methyltransferase [Pseudomonadota bacterium]